MPAVSSRKFMQHASPEQSQNLLNKLRQCSRAGGQALLLFSDFGRQMSTLYLSAVHFHLHTFLQLHQRGCCWCQHTAHETSSAGLRSSGSHLLTFEVLDMLCSCKTMLVTFYWLKISQASCSASRIGCVTLQQPLLWVMFSHDCTAIPMPAWSVRSEMLMAAFANAADHAHEVICTRSVSCTIHNHSGMLVHRVVSSQVLPLASNLQAG